MRWRLGRGIVVALALVAVGHALGATSQFFRVRSPGGSVITAFDGQGWLTWSNTAVDVTATVETAWTLMPANSWRSWVSSPVTSSVMRLRVTDPNPPSGMVLIPGGSNSGTNPLGLGEAYDSGWYPATYSLTVSSFYMDRYEVTKALWDEVKNWNGGNGYSYDDAGSGKGAGHPVHTVTWYDCVKWCNARSQKDGRTPVYYTDAGFTQIYKSGQVLEPYVKSSASGYRLPTDAQWEYAARGGASSKRFPWAGNTISHGQANYYAYNWSDYDLSGGGYHPTYETGGLPYTSPAGAFEAGKNAYGLYDIAGNVWEWCFDWYPGYVGSYRVYRGAGWGDYAFYCGVGVRFYRLPGSSDINLGFRAVLPPGQ